MPDLIADGLTDAHTWLFVPGNRSDRFAKARAAGADEVIVDLEDAVDAADKPAARRSVVEALRGAQKGLRVMVVSKAEDPVIPTRVAEALGCPVVAPVESASRLEILHARRVLARAGVGA